MGRDSTSLARDSARHADDGDYTRLESVRVRDVRASTPYFLSRSSLKAFVRRSARVASLAFLDVCGLALGLYAALALRELYVGNGTPLWGLLWEAETTWLPFVTLVTVLVFWHNGLYGAREARAGFGRILSSLVVVAVLTVAFALGSGHDFDTYAFAPTAVLLTSLFIGLFRASYEGITGALLHLAGVRRRTLLVGNGGELSHLYAALGSARAGIEYLVVGALAPSRDGVAVPLLGTLRDLPRVLESHGVDELVIAQSDLEEQDLLEIVDQAHRRGIHVRVAPKTTEILTQRAEYIPGQGIPLFELRPPVFAGSDWAIKRLFDLVVSSALLVGGLPLWVLIAVAIKGTSPGPVFYLDRRIGLNDRPFSMFKFRTMYVDAAERQAQLEDVNEAGGGVLFKIRDDPRITPVGAVLRHFSLDEIPQVVNVLRGEMSLVGPRPLPMRDYQRLESWHRKRYLVLPGMTGLWQISGRSNLGFDDLVRLDFYYLENWSVWLDIAILMKTVPAVLARRGAY